MDYVELFTQSNRLALAGWIVLVFGPRRYPWLSLIPSVVIPGCLSLCYSVLVAVHLFGAGGGFGSLAAVRTLFQSDAVLLAGWQHYLAFDLIVGHLAARRLDRAGIHRAVQAFVLLAVFAVGPFGYLLSLLAARVKAGLVPAALREHAA